MEFPQDLKYTKDHEWIKIEGNLARVGITEFAQSELGDLVFVDLPKVGKVLEVGKAFCVVESTKAASDVYAPISGTVIEANSKLEANPELVNSSPYTDGWLAVLENFDASAVEGLMSAAEYEKLLSGKV